MNSRTSLLLSGDLHIGRSSTRVVGEARSNDLRASTAWHRLVDLAIEKRVRLVCLSGDVADQDNKFWEAIGPLEEGVRRLAESGIQTVVVAGNHDFDVLPRLADQLPSEQFTLLGRGGKWERITINDASDQPILHVDGWSFPNQYVDYSPLSTYNLDRDANVPTLGIVHGDLNVLTSRYAPLEMARLQALPVDGWLLGHTHAPDFINSSPWLLYPGSLQALDPGEIGLHGPWIVNVANGRIGTPEQLSLSTVWYDHLEIDLSEAKDEGDLESQVHAQVRKSADQIKEQAGPRLVHVNLRLHLIGATPASHCVPAVAKRLIEDYSLQVGAGKLQIEKVHVQTTPSLDLEEHAEKESLPGSLAKLLLQLDQGKLSADLAKLVGEAQDALEQIWCSKEFAQLNEPKVSDALAREYLRTTARELLTHLMTQKP